MNVFLYLGSLKVYIMHNLFNMNLVNSPFKVYYDSLMMQSIDDFTPNAYFEGTFFLDCRLYVDIIHGNHYEDISINNIQVLW